MLTEREKTGIYLIVCSLFVMIMFLFVRETSAQCGLPQCEAIPPQWGGTVTNPLRFADTYTVQLRVSNPVECGKSTESYNRDLFIGWGGYSCTTDIANCEISATLGTFTASGATNELTFTVSMIATDTATLTALTNSCVHAGAGTGDTAGLTTTGIVTYESGCNLDNCAFERDDVWTYYDSYSAIHDGTGWITRGNAEGFAGFWQAITVAAGTSVCVKFRGRGVQAEVQDYFIKYGLGSGATTDIQVYNEWGLYTSTYETQEGDDNLFIGIDTYAGSNPQGVHYQVDDVCLGIGAPCAGDDPAPTPTPGATATPLPGEGGYCPKDCVPAPADPAELFAPMVTWVQSQTVAVQNWGTWVTSLTNSIVWE